MTAKAAKNTFNSGMEAFATVFWPQWNRVELRA
jgi:hypothetical protein